MPQFTISQLITKESDYTIQDTDLMMITIGTQTTDLSSIKVSFNQFAEWIVQTYAANHGLSITGNVAMSGLSAIGSNDNTVRFAELPTENTAGGRTAINRLKQGDLFVALSGDSGKETGIVCIHL
tara:strand:- start:3332 stop:3706 length:375 start_codon:yes stop_codon:yes gene_type:complete